MDEQSIFLRALEQLTSERRAAWLDKVCGSNAPLRERIEALLRRHEQAGGFLEEPTGELGAAMVPDRSGHDRTASLDAGLAATFGEGAAVVIGSAGHSVLKSLGQTMDVPRVVLRESAAAGADPVTRPSPPEIPGRDSESRYQLQGEIARGGMGAILMGRDTDLGRDLAIKVLLDEHKTKPEVIQRFVEEAQIGGQLQHPGIAPVYELGQFADKRPFFSMKLVKGQTLAKLLADRDEPAEDRAKFIGIFEHVCQTMAYAHSRGVLHRDLKPANIMVGAFGEVQVMDWGLAKVLPAGGIAEETTAAHATQEDISVIQTCRTLASDSSGAVDSVGSQTQMGSVMGTPAYMPPEQALGQIDNMDERADVFGLGAILCEVLTGKPPYVADDGMQVYRLACRGKLDDCMVRLDASGADEDLIALAKHCLEPAPKDRPRNAGELAERVTGYLESVEIKLRATELQRAAQAARADAEAARAVAEGQRATAESRRAAEESKRRRVTLALAASVLLLIGLGSGSWVYLESQQADRRAAATKRVNQALGEAQLHQGLAAGVDTQKDGGLDQKVRQQERALRAAEQAAELAVEEAVDPDLRAVARKLWTELRQHATEVRALAERVAADRAFEEELELIRLSRAGGDGDELAHLKSSHLNDLKSFSFELGDPGIPQLFDKATAARQYEQAFRNVGWDVATLDVSEAAEWIRESAVRETVITALDDWARMLPADAARTEHESTEVADAGRGVITRGRLRMLADAADNSLWRQELRAALFVGDTARLETLGAENEDRRPSPALIAWLGAALRDAKKFEASVAVLRQAQQQQPGDFWLNFELGQSLKAIDGNEAESLGYGRAALSIRPRSPGAHRGLAGLLFAAQRYEEMETVLRQAIQLDSESAHTHNELGVALWELGRLDEAIAACHESLKLDQTFAGAQTTLAGVLWDQGNKEEAVAAYRTAIEFDPTFVIAHANLGLAMANQKKWNEASAAFLTAAEFDQDSAFNPADLDVVLANQEEQGETSTPLAASIGFRSMAAVSHVALGSSLAQQEQWDEAVTEFQAAIKLNPTSAICRLALGITLVQQQKWDAAIDELRLAVQFGAELSDAREFLDLALQRRGQELVHEGNLDDAAEHFADAFHLAADRAGRGAILAQVRRFEGLLERVAERLPDDSQALVALVGHYQDRGEREHAAAARARALALCERKRAADPEDADAAADLAELLLQPPSNAKMLVPMSEDAGIAWRLKVEKYDDPWTKLAAAHHLQGDEAALADLLRRRPEAAVYQAELHAAAGQWRQVIAVCDKLIPGLSTNRELLIQRATAYAAIEQWRFARADWLRVIQQQPDQLEPAFNAFHKAERWSEASDFGLLLLEQSPDDATWWLRVAPVVAVADEAAYRQYCERMANQFSGTNASDQEVEKICKAGLLRADAMAPEKLPGDRLAESLDDNTAPAWLRPYSWAARALLAYRSNDAQSALEYVAKSQELRPNKFIKALNPSVQALALYQMGRADEARGALDDASRIINTLKKDPGNKGHLDLLMAEILFREAEAKINE